MELRFDQASRRFGEQLAFEIPQLAIRSGELFAFVGPANAGKSTVLNVIAGVERLSSGTLTAAGRILNDVPEAERDAVLVPPARLLDPGPQSILLFDDPLRASAAGERDRLLAGLKRLHAARRSTFILATADQAQALALADRLAVMADGRLHQVGSAAEIVDAPATTFVASYFGAPPMNVVPGILEKDGQAVEIGPRAVQLGCIVRDTYARDVFLGIRPEYVRLRPAEQGGWRGKVVRVERLGDDTVVEVAVDLGKFVARTAGPPFCGVGDTVGILLPVRHFHVFDSRGERLETV